MSATLKPTNPQNPFAPQPTPMRINQAGSTPTPESTLTPTPRPSTPSPRPSPTPTPLETKGYPTGLYEQGPVFTYKQVEGPKPYGMYEQGPPIEYVITGYPYPEPSSLYSIGSAKPIASLSDQIIGGPQSQLFVSTMNKLIAGEQENVKYESKYALPSLTPAQEMGLGSEVFRIKTEEAIAQGNPLAIFVGRVGTQVYAFPQTLATLIVGVASGKSKLQVAQDIQAQTYETERRMGELFYSKPMSTLDYVGAIGSFTWESAVGQMGLLELGGEVVGGLAKAPIMKFGPTVISKLGEGGVIGQGVVKAGETIVSHPRAVEALGVAALGGMEAYKVSQQIQTGAPPHSIIAGVMQDLGNVTMFGIGLGEGLKQGVPLVRDIKFIGKTEIPVGEIVSSDVRPMGAEEFPNATNPRRMVQMFRSPEYKLEDFEVGKAAGYHTTANPPKIEDLAMGDRGFVTEVGETAGAPGLHVAPSLSPHFLRIGEPLEEAPSRLITGMENPKVLYITAEDVKRMPEYITRQLSPKDLSAGVDYLTGDIPKGYFYITPAAEAGKTEAEALVAPGAQVEFKSFQEYVKLYDVKVPIERYGLTTGSSEVAVDVGKLVGGTSISEYAGARSYGLGFLAALGMVSTPKSISIRETSEVSMSSSYSLPKISVSSIASSVSSSKPTISSYAFTSLPSSIAYPTSSYGSYPRPSYTSYPYTSYRPSPSSYPSPSLSSVLSLISLPSAPSSPSYSPVKYPSAPSAPSYPTIPIMWNIEKRKRKVIKSKVKSLLWEWRFENPNRPIRALTIGIVGNLAQPRTKRKGRGKEIGIVSLLAEEQRQARNLTKRFKSKNKKR